MLTTWWLLAPPWVFRLALRATGITPTDMHDWLCPYLTCRCEETR